LAYYLRRRDCIAALAADLEIEEDEVIPTVMTQLFECLRDLHAAGLVHRDVKPANIVFAEDEKRFKLIDLGAAADLRTGTNYQPESTILDPYYCPPEEYVLPTDAPHLAKTAAPFAMVMSPVLWQQHRPDCFDTFSAGVVLLQLGLPFLRSQSTLKNWRTTFARCGYDVNEWKARASLSARQTALLDVDGGWDLVAGLLRPRDVELDGRGGVRFVNTGGAPRLTPQAALRHPYLKKAVATSGNTLQRAMSLGSIFSSTSSLSSTDIDNMDGSTPSSGSTSNSRGQRERRGSSSESRSATPRDRTNVDESLSTTTAAGIGDKAAASWGWFKNKLFDLEARIAQQSSETQTQTTIVQRLREEVAAGRASRDELEREEGILLSMRATLQASAGELGGMYQSAKGFMSSVLRIGGTGSKERSQQQQPHLRDTQAEAPRPAAVSSGSSTSPSSPLKTTSATSSNSTTSSRDVGKVVSDAATNAIYSGLKLTGMALNAVADMAAAAERGMVRAQEEAAAQRAAMKAYVSALQGVEPPVGPESNWDAVSAAVPESDEYALLSMQQRKQAFEAYVEALRRIRKAAEEEARRALSASASVPPAGVLSGDGGSGRKKGLDDGIAAEGSGVDQQQPDQAAKSNQGTSTDAPRDASVGSSSTIHGSSTARGENKLQQLDAVLAEQARLKQEYEEMERKLKEMEKALRVTGLVGSLLDGEPPVIESDNDGSVVFRFANGGLKAQNASDEGGSVEDKVAGAKTFPK
jgi:serine/threonine protein kinase